MRVKLIYIKSACYLMIVSALAHIAGHFWLIKPASEEEIKVLAAMTSFERNFAGGTMSPKDIIDGLNLCYALFFIYAAVMNLVLIRQRPHDFRLIKVSALTTAITLIIGSVISVAFFFWYPVLLFIIMSFCFFITFLQLSKKEKR